MNEADLAHIFTREDLAPETALEVVNQATSPEEMIHILVNLAYYFRKAISNAEADDRTKTEASFYLGEFTNALSLSLRAFPLLATYRFHNKELLYSFIKDHLMRLARRYADIKNGKPLKDIVNELRSDANVMYAFNADNLDRIKLALDYLDEELRRVTLNT
jgi:aminopeptidase C